MHRAGWKAAFVALTACGGAQAPAQGAASTGAAACAPPEVVGIAPAKADVVLAKDASARVGGQTVAFDGVAEGLAWPALAKSVAHAPGAPLVFEVARDVPVQVVLRAAWALRDADVRVQTPDEGGAVRVIDLAPKPTDAAPPGTCHLAVFVAEGGALRVASPGGPRLVAGPSPTESFVRALGDEATRCPIRYVGFGADRPDAPWSRVFDVAWAVTRAKAAGDARVVLAEPITASK
jgi:hypothetical protein